MMICSLLPRLVPPVVFLALLLCFGTAAAAQAGAERPRIAVRAGVALAGTGDGVNCAYAGSVVGGLDARTRGVWFAAFSGDLHLGLPLACADVGTFVPYGEDQWAMEEGGVFFALAPRVGLRVGVAPRQLPLEVAFGGGGVLGTELGSSRASLQPWASGTAALYMRGGRWAIQTEYGAHRVVLRHELYSHEAAPTMSATVRYVPRWQPLFQLALRREW